MSPMMQTVIRWRRPSIIDTSSPYPCAHNPCSCWLGNSLCYVVSGCLLLVVGVIITSLTFQNLDGSTHENKERYAGPVLIAAGVLVMARGALGRLWPSQQRTLSARHRTLLRQYLREIYSRPIYALQRGSSLSLCHMESSDLHSVSSRSPRLYSDDPPSYDMATSGVCSLQGLQMYAHAYTNPANDVEDEEDLVLDQHDDDDDDDSDEIHNEGERPVSGLRSPPQIVITASPDPPILTPGEDDHSAPPPSYDEYILSASMKTTSL